MMLLALDLVGTGSVTSVEGTKDKVGDKGFFLRWAVFSFLMLSGISRECKALSNRLLTLWVRMQCVYTRSAINGSQQQILVFPYTYDVSLKKVIRFCRQKAVVPMLLLKATPG